MIWRSGFLGLVMLLGSVTGVLAHALPGSVLLFRQEGTELRLTIRFPVEDLVVAAPELAGLEEVPPEGPLPQELANRLSRYLGDHLSLTDDGLPLELTLAGVRIQPAWQEHLGHYALMVTDWTTTRAVADPAPLVLTYDAVMHEVRNHRATVQWIGESGVVRLLADFGYYDAADGIPLGREPDGQD